MKNASFITLMALLMSCPALSIDAMLPALSGIGYSLGVTNANDIQFIVSGVFVGMGIGLFFYGPLSDSYGRKLSIYLGSLIFLIGCLVSIFATDLDTMVIGRILQGFGVAASRVVVVAMIRDKFKGDLMAQIMSFVFIIFIIVPVIAPALGQVIYAYFGWRWIFALMLFVSVIGCVWLFLGQEETLPKKNRVPFSLTTIMGNSLLVLRNPITIGYTICSGLVFGSFIGYLNTSQQLLQVKYGLGNLFSVYFGLLAVAIGVSSFINSRLVIRYGMVFLSLASLIILAFVSTVFFLYMFFYDGVPPLYSLMGYLGVSFLFIGILFSNFNSLALEPMGHIAGTATSIISCLQMLFSVAVGGPIGVMFNGTVIPLVSGFLAMYVAALLVMLAVLRINRIKETAGA